MALIIIVGIIVYVVGAFVGSAWVYAQNGGVHSQGDGLAAFGYAILWPIFLPFFGAVLLWGWLVDVFT